MTYMHNPPHPGEVLREYLGSLTVSDVAAHIGVNSGALQRIVDGTAGISADIAFRLGDAFGTSPEFWAGMQLESTYIKLGNCSCQRLSGLRPRQAT